MTGVQIAILVAIILAVVLGFKTNINVGLFAMAFAYIIGCFFMGMKPVNVLTLWPIKIFFILFSVNLFYSFANVNGTLEKVAMVFLYSFRGRPALWPFAIYTVSALITIMGAGIYACIALLVPISFMLCEKTKMNPIIGAMAVSTGSQITNNFITTACGQLVREYISSAGFSDQAFQYTMYVFITTLICYVINFLGVYLILGGYKVKALDLDIEKPAPFTKQQRTNLILIAAMMLVLLLPPVLHNFFPSVHAFAFLDKHLDVGFVSIIMVIMALLLKVGDQKEAFKLVPWSTIIMISGIGIIVALATQAGVLEYLAGVIGKSGGSPTLVTVLMALLAGFMSIFSSTTGVVLPTLYPLVQGISAATGTSAALLFVGIQLGSLSTGCSPFSTGGGIMLGFARDDQAARRMYPSLMVVAAGFLTSSLLQIAIMSFIF